MNPARMKYSSLTLLYFSQLTNSILILHRESILYSIEDYKTPHTLSLSHNENMIFHTKTTERGDAATNLSLFLPIHHRFQHHAIYFLVESNSTHDHKPVHHYFPFILLHIITHSSSRQQDCYRRHISSSCLHSQTKQQCPHQ